MAESPEYRRKLARGEYAEAERLLHAALARSTDAAAAPLVLDAVRLYHALNEPERAAASLGRARELHAQGKLGEASLKLAAAVDHLATGDARAASELLAWLTREGEAHLDARERHEAWVLCGEAEQALGNSFRAWKAAEKGAGGPGTREEPGLVARAMLVLARSHLLKGAHERAEEMLQRARDLAVREDLRDRLAEATAAIGEAIDLKPGPGGRQQAEACFAGARDLWERIALELEPERRAAFLSHSRRQLGRSPAARGEQSSPPATRRLVATLSEMSALIASMTDLSALLERVMDVAIGIVGAERGLIMLFEDGDPERVEVRVARNLEGAMSQGVQEFSRNVLREVARGQEVVTFDTLSDERLKEQQSVLLYSIRSLVCFPLKLQDQVLGAVYLDNQRATRVYSPEDLDFLRAFTTLAALAIQNSRLLAGLKEENVYLKRVATDRFRRTNLLGSSPPMERVFHLVEKAMESSLPVLVTGETGTGKEIVTKAIHFGSPRKDKAFIAQNCAAIPSELLESEMFGYKRGAFTGADQDKKGLLEIAHGGTLFLDEVGELDLGLQAKLLRALQEGLIRRVGESVERKVDVRIIAATNRNLKEAVERGTFRLDLFYRLNVLQIELPPLRARLEDIPQLAQHFLEKSNKQMGKAFRGFTQSAMDALKGYHWPGNVRELENAVARAAVFAEGTVIDLDNLPAFVNEGPGAPAPPRAAAREGPAPVSAPNEARARLLLAEVEAAQQSFWDVVKRPFLKRDIPREVVREVIRLAMEKSGWRYTNVLKTLRLPPDEYRRFMNFLAKFNLKVERPGSG